jgi:transcriptional regulator with XRE-family HTH domain
MIASKRKKLEDAGWRVGSAAELLGLSAEEELLVEMKSALASSVKQRRQRLELTQQQLAKRIGSSQSRVAKIEAADKSVSIELLVRSLASLGASKTEIGMMIAGSAAETRPQTTHRKRITVKRNAKRKSGRSKKVRGESSSR